ncbi:hypothetical protein BDN72DRAFT_871770 [Pluteus cervinus]|uniref:Uncharacterized protein n=1 Tax=Pluteus cervinus TaxID=181527 RepID=A0ACD3AJ69_9AGAR|nr:hypothetical protein BDN72DRAFT_871770 [Pluteus cervinus]
MTSFIKCLLGWKHPDLTEGIFGKVSGYYGCVEAQGRGSLHCHMLVWLEDSLNPTEVQNVLQRNDDPDFSERLMTFLDEIISNDLPTMNQEGDEGTRVNPCRRRDLFVQATPEEQAEDLAALVNSCQVHRHCATCYKYYNGIGPKECRFGLDENTPIRPITFDPESGEITMKQLNGMVNNFNPTVLRCLRCNMDIKYIGSGGIAKALMYYITDYITKPGTNNYVAYATLEATLRRCEDTGVMDLPEDFVRRKKLYQKCVFGQLAQQELSSQQVASYLMDYGDGYRSHKFRKLFWTSAEQRFAAYIDSGDQDRDSLRLSSTEDVLLSLHEGTLVPRSDQLTDYLHRPVELEEMSLWDFVAFFARAFLEVGSYVLSAFDKL